MPAPLSVGLRQRILAAYEVKEGSQRQLAEQSDNRCNTGHPAMLNRPDELAKLLNGIASEVNVQQE